MPAPFTSAVAMKRQAWRFEQLKATEQPKLTPDLLAAYVDRQKQELESRKERLQAAVEAGRQTYREERQSREKA